MKCSGSGTRGAQSKFEAGLLWQPGSAHYKLNSEQTEVVVASYLIPCYGWHQGHGQRGVGYEKMLPSILQVLDKSLDAVLAFTLSLAAQHEQCAE